MSKRTLAALSVMVVVSVVLVGCGPSAPPTPVQVSCQCPLTGSTIKGSADDGSIAEIGAGTCVQPPPCVQTVTVKARLPGKWGLTGAQLASLQQQGEIWSVLDITPDGRTWDPEISVWFTLKQPAPMDNFTLTIRQWREADQQWRPAGTATAARQGDPQAIGKISHTTLFALVDESTKPPPEAPSPVAEFTAVPGQDARLTDDKRVQGGCQFEVIFMNLSKDADRFFWDFGDGETSTEPNPTHIYRRGDEGTLNYTVTLVVEGPGGKDEEAKVDYIVSQCIG